MTGESLLPPGLYAVEDGFPYLPSGCYVHLDRVATAIVLDNLRAVIRTRHDLLVRELREMGDVSLGEFTNATSDHWTRFTGALGPAG